MLRRLAAIGLFALLLAPSAYLAWSLRAMPHLGYYHDDGIYWVSAKSLATGDGYRIASLPGQPHQTKYPPVFPALLALVWKVNPSFPANLPLATFVAWLLFPIFVVAAAVFFRHCGLNAREQVGLMAVAALSPVAVVFSFSLMPELLFTALFVTSILFAQRSEDPDAWRWLPLVAGVFGALAYLTKSAAAPLLLTAPLCFALRKQFEKAGLFIAGMLPAVAAWQAWVASHVSHASDLVTLYYTNYLGFQMYNVPWTDVPLVVWHNLDALLMGIGKLLTFDVPYGSKHLERVVAAAAIAGCVRLARRTEKLQYPVAALAFTLLLLVWHYTPDQRFVFPLYPLLLAGLWTELKNVWQALVISWRRPAWADRTAALAGASLLSAFALFLCFTTGFGLFRFLPGLFDAYRSDLESRRTAYQWIAKNTQPNANVYAYDDPVLYLYTGRKACGLPVPPTLHYRDDSAGIERLLSSVPDFARQQHLSYVMITPGDFYRDEHQRGAELVKKAVQSSNMLQASFDSPGAKIYHIADPANSSLRSGL